MNHPEAEITAKVQKAMDLHQAGQLRQAEPLYREILQTHPEHPQALHGFGLLARDLGELHGAERLLQIACALNPGQPDPLDHLGVVLLEQNQPEQAADCFRQALELEPRRATTWYHLGNACKQSGQLQAAIHHYRHAIELAPDHFESHYNLGNLLSTNGHPDQAIPHYRTALALNPGHAPAHHNLSFALLLTGQLTEGWREYEWRWQVPGFTSPARNLPQPLWDGSPQPGQRILLHAEQGLGDTIQMVRYVPLVAAKGLKVILEIPAPLARLCTGIPGVETTLIQHETSTWPDFDCHAPLMSLPLLLGTTWETIPATIPYLLTATTPEQQAIPPVWGAAQRQPGRLHVGVVWAGRPTHANDAARSMPATCLAPLMDIEEVVFFSLQQGERARELDHPALGKVENIAWQLTNLADAAHALQAMDLLISVDTAPAHVAGAVGVPVWLLLPFAPDWRWGLHTETTPWYPGMRLFRQSAPDTWPDVMARVAAALRHHVEQGRSS